MEKKLYSIAVVMFVAVIALHLIAGILRLILTFK
jgi:hypothetical protein